MTPRSKCPRGLRARGFTLVELAVVLVVIGLLLGGLLGPLSTRIEQSDRERTQALLEDAKEALYGFAVTNGRLPCPDQSGNGVEEPVGGAGGCTAVQGLLPAATLGVPQEDAWARPFRYRVTGLFADTDNSNACGITPEPPPTVGVSFKLCSDGNIRVSDGAGGAIVADDIPAVILSFGTNGNDPNLAIGGTLSNHENENIDDNRDFVLRTYGRDDASEYDDLLVWISPNILRNRMVVAGRLP